MHHFLTKTAASGYYGGDEQLSAHSSSFVKIVVLQFIFVLNNVIGKGSKF